MPQYRELIYDTYTWEELRYFLKKQPSCCRAFIFNPRMPVMFDITFLDHDMWKASLVSSEQYIYRIMGGNGKFGNDSESDIFQQNLSAIAIPCV